MIYYIEKKVGSEWLDVCLPTRDESLARRICYRESTKDSCGTSVRVATYDDREEDASVIAVACSTGWK